MNDFALFENITRRFYENNLLYKKMSEQYPYTYSTLILEDEFVDDSLKFIDILINTLFPNHYECLMWFMYDWKPGYDAEVDGKIYVINDLEDYLKFKKETWV